MRDGRLGRIQYPTLRRYIFNTLTVVSLLLLMLGAVGVGEFIWFSLFATQYIAR